MAWISVAVGSQEHSDSGYILKVVPAGFPDELNVGFERRRVQR